MAVVDGVIIIVTVAVAAAGVGVDSGVCEKQNCANSFSWEAHVSFLDSSQSMHRLTSVNPTVLTILHKHTSASDAEHEKLNEYQSQEERTHGSICRRPKSPI